ncbi:LADA_0A02960g1_1 [Lachancea dasiensis]|uniref:RNA helicase n=1 Tax=Lachancea dasiensis TaxID=1072105 RepID=A0A1G4IMV1_9SACH|nr:LADA_0A02960g1_1 [Lachancea dasiensis]
MSAVSADVKKKLLLERRNKWKQKKAEFDALKVQQETNLNISDGNDESDRARKLAERKSKLESWRQKRSENAQADVAKLTGSQRGNKTGKAGKKRIFDDSDEEENVTKVQLFHPVGISVENDERGKIETDLISKNDSPQGGDDPLERFMNTLDKLDDSSTFASSEVLHGIGNNKDINSDVDGDEFVHGTEGDHIDEVETEFRRLKKLKSKKRVKKIAFGDRGFEPFTKNFYVVPEEIRNMTDTEVDELRLSLDNVIVKGQDCPRPILKWSHLGLTTDIMNLITQELRFLSPTPIQAQAIPAIMSGRDVIGISKTGSGKTVSFLLPLMRQIRSLRPLSKDETGPLGLILAPTRELAVQIHQELVIFTRGMPNVRSICCTGGSELKKQINDLKRGVEVVVATPGRFIDLLTLNSGKLLHTERVTFVVMDEADRLFDLGFEPQITEIMKTVRPDKQCVLFSATFPAKLKSFASRILTSPISITINSKSLINENIEQRLEIYDSDDKKFEGLLYLLDRRSSSNVDNDEQDEKTIVFVSSQQICDLIQMKLADANYTVYAIHAGKPYNERASNLEKFKNTKNGILLCTEVLSRGLNVPEVSLVIIYNAVKTFAQYVHTTGRTARGANHGVAITLLLADEFAASYILNKSFRDNEVEALPSETSASLKAMAEKFESGMKTGKYRLTKGFGGKGLEHMEKINDVKHDEELKQYGVGERDANAGSHHEPDENLEQITVPKLDYVFHQSNTGSSHTTYSAEVNVNDLPQVVRWEATKNTTLSFVIHETACSITNRGKFYPDGGGPTKVGDEPKLYLLIEAQEEKDVRLAIELLEEKVREGVKKFSVQEARSTKF